ncbi:MAG: flavodoxin reductase [Deltaproteobacteria bacterium]|nr:flavodoxin reductase [Deltaproteobacteria bacterium]
MKYKSSILMTEFVTHDVKRFIIGKPENFIHEPGQGVELVINKQRWKDEEGRPFTPTSLPHDQVLEFTIKCYPGHHGVTEKLHGLQPGDELFISEPFGTIRYKGPGVFIAAGAGITPFLGICRHLVSRGNTGNHQLLFANKTKNDIICEKELRHFFGADSFFILSKENTPGYYHGRITSELLRETVSDFSHYFYVCGPEGFVTDMHVALQSLGAEVESLVFEE